MKRSFHRSWRWLSALWIGMCLILPQLSIPRSDQPGLFPFYNWRIYSSYSPTHREFGVLATTCHGTPLWRPLDLLDESSISIRISRSLAFHRLQAVGRLFEHGRPQDATRLFEEGIRPFVSIAEDCKLVIYRKTINLLENYHGRAPARFELMEEWSAAL